MLPIVADRSLNFLSEEAAAAAESRLVGGDNSGIVEPDRLLRNLLSSQPLCFNLFGHFQRDPSPLLPWVRTIDPEASIVTKIRLEWAPPRQEHFGGGSAFDAFVEYEASGRGRFLGIECKYAEDLADSSIKVRQPYFDFTETRHHWREGAADRLDSKSLRQFWLNTLLAQSLVERMEHFESGTGIVMACAADIAARRATGLVRSELHEPDRWLRWVPYEEMLAAIVDPASAAWKSKFTARYLDFSPVAHLLTTSDPRLHPPTAEDRRQRLTSSLQGLLGIGRRVTGTGSVIEQILARLDDGTLEGVAIDLDALAERADRLTVDLKTFRQACYDP
jgi:hypothetical protein